MPRIIYLDNNATTPCAPEVVEGMLPFLSSDYGNPSSPHAAGRKALRAVEAARADIANAVGCDSADIIFTSGATESNNLALLGAAEMAEPSRRRVLVGAIEHKSVLAACHLLVERGFVVEEIPVDDTGTVRIDAVERMLGPDVLVVAVQAANNEVGTLQPVEAIARLAHKHGSLVHCDAAQALGKIDIQVARLGVDMASFSGHKVYGPKGIGTLFLRRGMASSRIAPILAGGGQELNLRPGTLNVPGIVGMGIACKAARSRLPDDVATIASLRDRLEAGVLHQVPGAKINGSRQNRLPGTSSISVKGVPADVLIANVPQLCISTGSACTSGANSPSHMLLAMGLSREDAECTIRISMGRYTTLEDVDAAIELLTSAVSALRGQLAL
jgi:cysteine desulfurase